MNTAVSPSLWRRAAPGLLLMLAAPLCTEVLPGATRLSSLFVLPIEICVWGGGALLIREIVRRRNLGWGALVLLGLALSIAEECLIQQTSLAPLVIKLKGVEYARAFGVNYVYFAWALAYETVFVVLVPIALVELVFARRAREPWVNRGGAIAVSLLFVVGALLAWFSWTQIARVKVFHLPPYTPPVLAVALAAASIAVLVSIALRGAGASKASELPAREPAARGEGTVPNRWVLGVAGAIWATLWYALVVLAFGLWPAFPPALAVTGALAISAAVLVFVPRWTSAAAWGRRDTFALVFGTMLGSMLVSFFGFIGSAPADFWFKLIADAVATVLLIALGRRTR